MEILTPAQVYEWTNIETGVDATTLTMLEGAGIDHVEFLTNRPVRQYHLDDGTPVIPVVPPSLEHAIALFISAHYDNRNTPDPASMMAIQSLCAPFRVWTL